LETPTVYRDGWVFAQARLFVHRCERKACADCAVALAKGWRVQRVSEASIRDGRALDVVAGRLWAMGQPARG
jgi:hypothetical protein